MSGKEFAVGIDLHGTLLDDRWEIRKDLLQPMLDALDGVANIADVYVCSGNDLTFIERYVPALVRERFTGYILETGCVISDGEDEEVLPPAGALERVKELEALLKEEAIPEVRYFARRLATVSAFTRDEAEGISPEPIFRRVADLVEDRGFADEFYVTHSNVAVDIIPKGFNKFTALNHAATGHRTVGIADSLNDAPMILKADLGYIPSNASPGLVDLLKKEGIPIVPIAEAGEKGVGMSSATSTEFVIEVLESMVE